MELKFKQISLIAIVSFLLGISLMLAIYFGTGTNTTIRDLRSTNESITRLLDESNKTVKDLRDTITAIENTEAGLRTELDSARSDIEEYGREREKLIEYNRQLESIATGLGATSEQLEAIYTSITESVGRIAEAESQLRDANRRFREIIENRDN